ncbi:MAG TPA: hypothetical protein VMI30_12850 [Stellaceae bacterium]|nr:hypothetical protein [Stellaceae bacterium]
MMGNISHTLSGLITKRAEIAARIVDARAALRQLIVDLDNIDAAIRIFDPAYNVEAIKPKAPTAPHGVSFRGEFVRLILDMMREAKGPVTTKEIALHVMRQRGINTADVATLALFNRRTRALLYHYQERGVVRAVQGNDEGRRRFNWWELAG